MNEEWRDIPGYEGLYQINIDTMEGKCRRICKNGKVREISNNPNKDQGRIKWRLSKDGKAINHQAAKWIALTYPELIQNEWFPGAEIDHIDTNRLNNHPSNLRWVTRKENNNNPLTKQHKSGVMKSEETKRKLSETLINHPDLSKWVIKLSKDNEILHFYPSIMQASRETGINFGNISACCQRKRKTAGGYIWKYADYFREKE